MRAGTSPAFQNVCHCPRGLKIRSPVSPNDLLVAKQRTHPALEYVAVLVLAAVAVQRGGQGARREAVLDEREAAAGVLAADHETVGDGLRSAQDLPVLRTQHAGASCFLRSHGSSPYSLRPAASRASSRSGNISHLMGLPSRMVQRTPTWISKKALLPLYLDAHQ